MTKPIDLRTCKPGAKLLTRSGETVTLLGRTAQNDLNYPYFIEFNDGERTTYTCTDIVKILDTGSTTLLSWLFYFAVGAAAGTTAGIAIAWALEHL